MAILFRLPLAFDLEPGEAINANDAVLNNKNNALMDDL